MIIKTWMGLWAAGLRPESGDVEVVEDTIRDLIRFDMLGWNPGQPPETVKWRLGHGNDFYVFIFYVFIFCIVVQLKKNWLTSRFWYLPGSWQVRYDRADWRVLCCDISVYDYLSSYNRAHRDGWFDEVALITNSVILTPSSGEQKERQERQEWSRQ